MKNAKPKQNLKTPEQIQNEIQAQKVAERQEEIVINARNIVLPVLKEKDISVEDSKLVCDLLAVVLQQGQVTLLSEHKVSDLKLLDMIKDEYPQSEIVRELITKIEGMTMMEGINMLQWMVSKINKTVEDENKGRKFTDLGIDF